MTRDNLRWAYSGIRPLYDDGASKAQEATRDYVLKLDQPEGGAPLLSVFGGKITTFRKLAESAMEKIEPFFPQMGKPWTAVRIAARRRLSLCRGGAAHRRRWRASIRSCTPRNVRRLFRAYGTDVEKMLEGARFAADLGQSFGPLERARDRLAARPRNGRAVPTTSCGGARSWGCT